MLSVILSCFPILILLTIVLLKYSFYQTSFFTHIFFLYDIVHICMYTSEDLYLCVFYLYALLEPNYLVWANKLNLIRCLTILISSISTASINILISSWLYKSKSLFPVIGQYMLKSPESKQIIIDIKFSHLLTLTKSQYGV